MKKYARLGFANAVIQWSGYSIIDKYGLRNSGFKNNHSNTAENYEKSITNVMCPIIQGAPSAESKYEVLRRSFELGEDVEYVSREIGYSRMIIYIW